MQVDLEIEKIISIFEDNNNFKVPEFIKDCIKNSNLIQMNQINDIKNQEFNHISFMGNYLDLLNKSFPLLTNLNGIIEDEVNFVYVNKQTETKTFKPNHTSYSFKCKYVEDLNLVFNGGINHNDYFILLNTDNEKLKYNVYAFTKGTNKESDYVFMVLIGKIINFNPYLLDDIENFDTKYNLNLTKKFKNYLENNNKVLGLTIENKNRLFYLNLMGDDILYKSLSKKYTRGNINKFDLEDYRKKLNNFWEKVILDEYTDDDKKEYEKLKLKINEDSDNFLNGFMRIGTIENRKYLFSELNQDLIIELYILLNVDENKEELEGSLWIYQLSDPGNCSNEDINYLPIRKMLKIGNIYQFTKNI